MKRRTIRAGMAPVSGPLRRSLPLLLQTLLVVALALPAGFAVAPAFLGPQTPANAAQPAPAWHQVPGTLAAARGRQRNGRDRTAHRRGPRPGARLPRGATQRNPEGRRRRKLHRGGAGRPHRGGPLRPFRRRGPRSRLQHEAPHRRRRPAHTRPGTPLQHQGRGRRRSRVCGADRRRGRAPRRGRISPGCGAGPCRARQPGAGDGPRPAGRRRHRAPDSPAGRLPLHRRRR